MMNERVSMETNTHFQLFLAKKICVSDAYFLKMQIGAPDILKNVGTKLTRRAFVFERKWGKVGLECQH